MSHHITKEKIEKEMNALYKCRKATLKEMVARHYRVIDLRGVDKGSLVSYMLAAKFGRNYDKILFAED